MAAIPPQLLGERMLIFVLNPECVSEHSRWRLLCCGPVVFSANLEYKSNEQFNERDAEVLSQCACVFDPRVEDKSGAWHAHLIASAEKLGLSILHSVDDVERFAMRWYTSRTGVN